MLKRLIKISSLILILGFTSCTTSITSPATSITYTGKISQEGISINVLPPFWSWAVEFYESLTQ